VNKVKLKLQSKKLLCNKKLSILHNITTIISNNLQSLRCFLLCIKYEKLFFWLK